MMKELNTTEITLVSGAGAALDHAAQIGAAIGGVIDEAATQLGLKSEATSAFTSLFTGIGYRIENDIPAAITYIGRGITAIIANGFSLFQQVFNCK